MTERESARCKGEYERVYHRGHSESGRALTEPSVNFYLHGMPSRQKSATSSPSTGARVSAALPPRGVGDRRRGVGQLLPTVYYGPLPGQHSV